MTLVLPALKGIGQDDWAGDRSPDVVGQMLDLQSDLRDAFEQWQAFSTGKLEDLEALPSVDPVEAAVSLLRWHLSWLDLDNLLRESFYGEPALETFQVIDAHLAWCSRHLGLTPEQFANLEFAVLPLAFKSAYQKALDRVAARKKIESAGDLWALAGPLPPDALSQALTTWLEKAAAASGQEVFDAIGAGLTFNLKDSRAAEFLQEYALAFSERTAKGSEEKIRRVLLEALAKGWTVEQTRVAIEAVHAGLWQYESERIARTEIIRAHAEGQLAALTDLGIQQKTWLAADDERTCPICGPRDGNTYPIDDDSVYIPAHPHCRCGWAMDEGELDRIRREILGEDVEPIAGTQPSAGPVAGDANPGKLDTGDPYIEAVRAALKAGINNEADVRAVGTLVRTQARLFVQQGSTLPEAYLQALSQVREMGNPGEQRWAPRTRTVVKQAVEAASRFFPSDWLELSNKTAMRGKTIKRGFYSEAYGGNPAVIALSGNNSNQLLIVAVHEMGHRFENVAPRIVALEREFYQRRTAGEALEWIGRRYKKSEKCRPDRWINRYIGKDYGGRWFEILTMGLQDLFTDQYDFSADPELQDFILGLLASI